MHQQTHIPDFSETQPTPATTPLTTAVAPAVPITIETGGLTNRAGFLSNVTTVLTGQLSSGLMALVVQTSYARFLGPAGRGQISLCLMVTALGVLLGGLGAEYPLTIWAAEAREKSRQWLPSVVVTGLLGAAFASAAWVLAYWKWSPPFLKGMSSGMAVIALAGIPLSIAVTYLMAALTGFERFRLRSVLALANQILGFLGILSFVFLFGAKPESALLGFQLGMLVCAIVTAVILRDFLRAAWPARISDLNLGPVLNFGLRGQVGNLATFFNYRLDVFIVNYFFDSTQVGLYAVGVLVSEMIWQIPHAAALTLFPRTARTVTIGATEFTCQVLRHVVLIAVVSGVVMALLSPLAVPLLFGARFAPSVPVIWWILPGTIALAVCKVLCADLAGRGKPEYTSICAFVSLAVTVSLDLLLIPRMGINGAALASSLAYLVQTVLMATFLKRQLRVSWNVFLVPTLSDLSAYRAFWQRSRVRLWLANSAVVTGLADR